MQKKNSSPESLEHGICALASQENASSLFYVNPLHPNKRQQRSINALVMTRLEAFMDELQANKDIPFVLRALPKGNFGYHGSPLATRHFHSIPDFIEVIEKLSHNFHYNPHITAFQDSCKGLNLLDQSFQWSKTQQIFGLETVTPEEAFNRLVADLRARCALPENKATLREWRRRSREQFQDYSRYVNAWFNRHARLVVLRVDLYYRKELADEITGQVAVADMDHLHRNKRSNKRIFGHCKAYIAKLEYGIDKGLHWHVIFFLNGDKRHGWYHSNFARDIGEYWSNVITDGRGAYWNCNDQYHEYLEKGICGIGPIHASDMTLRSNLLNRVVRYLCKSSQFFRPKVGPNIKLIRRGSYPKVQKAKRGRPRQHDRTE